MTKKQWRYYRAWANSGNTKLSDVYKKWSAEKERAYNQCLWEFNDNPLASQFVIISHNTFAFSVAWLVESDTEFRLHVCTPSGEDEFTIINK